MLLKYRDLAFSDNFRLQLFFRLTIHFIWAVKQFSCGHFQPSTLIYPSRAVSDSGQAERTWEEKSKKRKDCCHMKEALNSLTRRGHKPIRLAHDDTVCHPGEQFLLHIPFHFISSTSSSTLVSYILFVLAIISSLCMSLASRRLMNFLSLWIHGLLW